MCYTLNTQDKDLQNNIRDAIENFIADHGINRTQMTRYMGISQLSMFSRKMNRKSKENFTAKDLNNLKKNCPKAMDAILKKTQGRIKKTKEIEIINSAVVIGENNDTKVVKTTKTTKTTDAQASISAADFLSASRNMMNADSQQVLALFVEEDAASEEAPLRLSVSAWIQVVRVCLKLQKAQKNTQTHA